MKIKLALLSCLVAAQLFVLPLFAQTILVTGKVTSKSNEPLPGATIAVKGTNTATQSDVNGNFTINAQQGSVLLVTYTGMIDQEFTVRDNRTISIQMDDRSTSMNEVVVIGYGTQKKSVVTGAISSVKAGDLENQPINRVDQFLQGRASGISLAQATGQPGSGTTLRIRGITSINNSDPLYVVDGIPVDIGGIDYLNPYDIESIEVLKDAASAAIYGTRAASGVILVTTKKGRAGAIRVSYNGYYGTQRPARKLELLNGTQYATLRNEAILNDGGTVKYSNPESFGAGTDWQGLIFNNNAKIQDHEISFSGGNDKSTFFSSFGYFDQEGIIAPEISNYKRFTFRLNSSHKVTNWLNFGNNFSYSHIKAQGIGNTNSEYGGMLSSAVNLDPLTPVIVTDPVVLAGNPYGANTALLVRDPNGNAYGISSNVQQEMTNPLAYIQTHLGNFGWSDNFIGNVFLDVEPIKGLHVRSNLGAKYAFWGSESWTPLYFLNSSTSAKENAFYRENNRSLNYTWENTASYNRRFGFHNVTLLVGQGVYVDNSLSRNGGVTYRNLPVKTFEDAKSMNFSVTQANQSGWGSENTPHKVTSLYGRITYDYNERYLFTGIVRRDGSSRFGSNNKYGYFPSASVGWVITKESFFPTTTPVSMLKLRASYGINGNDNFQDFAYVSTIGGGRNYTYGYDNYLIGYSPNAPANPDLKWEETKQTDIGLDAVLFRNLTVTFDWFKKQTTGMLLQVALPGYVGATGQPWGNIANMDNTGIELELGYNRKIGGVDLGIKGNITHLKNEVTNIGVDKKYITGATLQSSQYELSRRAEVGQAFGSFYGFVIDGIFQTQAEVNSYVNKAGQKLQPNAAPGDFRWADLNGDGVIDANDRTTIGNPWPDWTFGLNLTAGYKGFDLVVFGQGVAGNQIFNGLRRLDIPTANWTTDALNRWTGPGTSTTFPRLTDTDPNHNFSNPSAFHLENGDYFRVKVLQLGYTLPTSLISRARLQKVRVFVSANNILTFTKYKGYDPEIGGGSFGIDRGYYPQAKSVTFGLNITL